MQPRILHMYRTLGLSPGAVPASNLVFVRSRREGDIAPDVKRLADLCWPFHRCVLETLQPRVVLCLGKTAGDYVRERVGAHELYATFVEENERRWAKPRVSIDRRCSRCRGYAPEHCQLGCAVNRSDGAGGERAA